MSGPPRVRSMNVAEADAEGRPVLVPAGNKASLVPPARKPASKPLRKAVERLEVITSKAEEDSKSPAKDFPPLVSPLSAPTVLRKHDFLLHSNLSLNASCSSEASTDSFCSRASTGRIGRASLMSRPRQSARKREKAVAKGERVELDGIQMPPPDLFQGKRKCSWVTPNAAPCYATFHDEEWGVPVHDDKKLFELLVFSGALAELTWPAILSKRNIFREVFMDFDPVAVSKLNEKKTVASGSTANSLLSEPKLRAVIENARQILKIMEEFGSFDRYCWSFVNHKPIISRFRYQRQVPVKTSKADLISKDLVRRGFRSVGPTVVYSFMQVAGLTNDHLISCFRFDECAAAASRGPNEADAVKANENSKMEGPTNNGPGEVLGINVGLLRAVDVLNIS